MAQLVRAGDTFALAPQVLAEFIHIATDPRRFTKPLSIEIARDLALKWWTAAEVKQVLPDAAAITKFFERHKQFRLGRKRLLDTLLAATYWQASVLSLLTTNVDDFAVFGVFGCVTPQNRLPITPHTPVQPAQTNSGD